PRPDKPVRLLRVPATDLRIEHRRAEQGVEVCRLALGQAVLADAVGRDLDPEPGRGRRTDAQRPVGGDPYLLGRAGIGDLPNFIARRHECRRPKRRRWRRPELARGGQEPWAHPRELPSRDRRRGCVADPEPRARWNGTDERSVETVTLASRNDLGTDRTTDRLTTGERGVHAAGAGVRLRRDHPLERQSLAGEQVGQHDNRRAGDGTAIEFESLSSARPDPNLGGGVFDVRSTVGGFRALHGQVLRDAEEGIRVRCSLGVVARLGDEAGRRLLPRRAGEAFGKRQTTLRRRKTKPRWSGSLV